jgi:hypothetical protein
MFECLSQFLACFCAPQVNILATRGSCNDKLSEEMTGARFTNLASSTRVPELDYFVECGEKLSAVRRPHNASNII